MLHITSLASPYGIGTLGEAALRFADFLSAAGVKYWQLLPINPIGAGNSPYFTPGVFAGEKLLIDLDELCAEGLLTPGECAGAKRGSDKTRVDFSRVKEGRNELFRLAFSRLSPGQRESVRLFSAGHPHIEQYAKFAALKNILGPAWVWLPKARAMNELQKDAGMAHRWHREREYQEFLQQRFFWQFSRLRAYAARQGVAIIGDLPIYPSPDGADLWSHPHLFLTGEDGRPTRVAGVPPDAFSSTGQLWGNPLYDWEAMAKDGYGWWAERMRRASALFDVVRLDHFRAFEQFWAVDADSATAQRGSWLEGPGIGLFDEIKRQVPSLAVIAEDLGTITDSVRELRRAAGFLGMRVMQFGFFEPNDNEHLPHRHTADTAVYTSTHDNDTLDGFVKTMPAPLRLRLRGYLGTSEGGEAEAMLRAAFGSVANLCVVAMQDLPEIKGRRMNRPGSVSEDNWSWRLSGEENLQAAGERLEGLGRLYART